MAAAVTLVWFRQDLRLQDNAALHAALAGGGTIVPVFVLDEAGEGRWRLGATARRWLGRSLAALDAALRERGSRLILARGDAATRLRELARATDAGAIFRNRRHEPAAIARDARVERELAAAGIEVRAFDATLLHAPTAIVNRRRRPFQVFTPFWRRCLAEAVAAPIKVNGKNFPAPPQWPRSVSLGDLELESGELTPWQPGEAGAAERLRRFLARGLERYADECDWPARDGTSRLSPHLHFGEIGPRQIWSAVRAIARDSGVFPPHRGAEFFLRELGWREFAYHALAHFPATPEQPWRAAFAEFPWADDPRGAKLRAWQHGETGYPIVDAGMRQLAATGWMHNRLRMIVASFLVKHLRLPWTRGAEFFWENLVDADLACNTLGWQWSAGCGADAAPYYRIFSPVLQGRKFDRKGEYVRQWLPELARVPTRFIHAPWEAPAPVLVAAGVRLGETYPRPIVEHARAREEALAAFRALRGAAAEKAVAPDAP